MERFAHLTVGKKDDWWLIELLAIYSNTWIYLTVCKRMNSGLSKNVINKMCLKIIYI